METKTNKNYGIFPLYQVFINGYKAKKLITYGAQVLIEGINGVCRVEAKKTTRRIKYIGNKFVYPGSFLYVFDEMGKEYELSKKTDRNRKITVLTLGNGILANRGNNTATSNKNNIRSFQPPTQEEPFQKSLENALKPLFKILDEQALSIATLSSIITTSSNSPLKEKAIKNEIREYLKTEAGKDLILEMLQLPKQRKNNYFSPSKSK